MVGTKATGSRLLTVTLYSDANGNNKLWQSTMSTTIDSSGVFNCTLGTADNPLPQPSVMDRPIWLGVAVDDGPELRPLSEMTATAYALNVVDNAITTMKLADGAVTSQKLADSSITTAKLANGSVTWNKMGTEYVPYIRVNGAKVNTGQNSINFTGGDGLRVDYDSNSMSVIIHPDSALMTGNIDKGAKPMFVGGNPTFSNSDNGVSGSGNHAGSTNTVGGGTSNTAFGGSTPDLNGHATIGGGESNTAKDTFATIGGGDTNTASGYESTISGGTLNTVTNRDGFIGGGLGNINKSRYSAMAGGDANFMDDSTDASFMGGGLANRIGFYGNFQIVGDTTYIGADVLSGGRNNFVKSVTAALVGGLNNTIDTSENEAFIGAGANNLITRNGANEGQSSAIVAGASNLVSGGNSFIGAGYDDTVTLGYAGIMAGRSNTDSGVYAVIGGGFQNTINGRNAWTANGGESFIGGGTENTVSNESSFVGAGYNDTIISTGSAIVTGHNSKIESSANYSFVGAGETNSIDTGSADASIVGGGANRIDTASPYSAIADGDSNSIVGSNNFIGGGHLNTINRGIDERFFPTTYSIIGSGLDNTVTDGQAEVIAGGMLNQILGSSYAVIGGGDSNEIDGINSVIGGGGYNTLDLAEYSVIGGGYDNTIYYQSYAVIAGGHSNFIPSGLLCSTISGGESNMAIEEYGTIGGGDTNSNYSRGGFIGGGLNNTVGEAPGGVALDTGCVVGGGFRNHSLRAFSGVLGGDTNSTQAFFSSIGGGQFNLTTPAAPNADIPGGDSLIANSFAQTVVGYNNIQSGTFTQGTPHATSDLPLFIVGNGDGNGPTPRSDAFEVSYDGHTAVTQTLADNNGPPFKQPIQGATYTDNVVYAWGDVMAGLPGPGPISVRPSLAGSASGTQSFGLDIGASTNPAAGLYVLVFDIRDASGTLLTLDGAAITVTPVDDQQATVACAVPKVHPLAASPGHSGQIQVDMVTMGTDCSAYENHSFMFHLTGRVH